MGDADPTVHRAATKSKRVIKAHSAEVTSAIKGWHEDLTSRDAAARYSAAEALGGMGRRAVLAIPALTRLLNDEDDVVRGAAHSPTQHRCQRFDLDRRYPFEFGEALKLRRTILRVSPVPMRPSEQAN